MSESNEQKIIFKKKSRLGQRRRRLSDESEAAVSEDTIEWNKLNELKQIQNQRKRNTKGINILEMTQNSNSNNTNNNNNNNNKNNININININNNNNNNNPKNDNKSGGLSDAKTLSNELDLGNTFSVETNRRDEDTDLMKYIEEELYKRKGTQILSNKFSAVDNNQTLVKTSNDITSLFDVLPDHLIANNAKKSEEMLSNQMLNGIPEVELGLDEKIRNIEATEEAKARLIESRNNKSNQGTSSFVPNNIAVCFVQHNRFNIGEDIQRLNSTNKRLRTETQQQSTTYVEEPVVVIGDEPKHMIKLQNKNSEQHHKGFYGKDKASDDYIFEKFKKQFRKF